MTNVYFEKIKNYAMSFYGIKQDLRGEKLYFTDIKRTDNVNSVGVRLALNKNPIQFNWRRASER